jgi:hypothetical protein
VFFDTRRSIALPRTARAEVIKRASDGRPFRYVIPNA